MGLGIGLIVGLASAAVGAASVIATNKASRKAREAQARAQIIKTAGEKVVNRAERRRAAREERIRRAKIKAQAEQAGAGTSSGLEGAIGGLRATTASGVAQQKSSFLTNVGISAALQEAQRAEDRAKSIQAFSNLAIEGINIFGETDIFG